MRKQVTFVEENNNADHLARHDSSRYLATRSAGSYCPHRGQCFGFHSHFSGQGTGIKTKRTSHLKATPQQISEGQQMKTIHIPKSMMAAPFLQHPSLTNGQKRYLYSIANVYSTEHMRKLMKQHYLNVLNQCIRAGQNGVAENRTPQLKKKHTFKLGSKTDSQSHERTKPNGDRHTAAVHSGKIILPRIANSHSRTTSSTSNERGSRILKTNANMARNASVKGTKRWEDPPDKAEKTEEEVLREDMSSLSIEQEEILSETDAL